MIFEALTGKETKLSLIGLGYVGMPIAVAFAKKLQVIGFDLNEEKIKRQSLGSLPAGSCDLFRFSVPVKEGVAQWKVVLYNYGDKEGAGMPLSTTVKIK